ncbi:MAG: hypothetical protein QF903_07355 [Planctomycetota bacterium]|jgi:hypothetical protein|nr:hypothetical protein [Planctomycetota bacterium]MDP6762466.1 hypothetical protein [Planctomycetota bacterium]MDP6989282.1 hypothetical protein [Planctomycetota bacterium]
MNRRTASLLLVGSIPALFCRFTVRDVAFVDLGDGAYHLYGFVADPEETDLDERLPSLATAVLFDSNVGASWHDPDGDLPPQAADCLSELQIQQFPVAVLAGPAGDLLEVPLGEEADPGEHLTTLIDSPVRRHFRDVTVETYCTVLLVSGGDAGADATAREAVEAAFTKLREVWDQMPKDVGRPPELVEVTEPSEERVLLWSLGIEIERSGAPAVAVLFGRGRRIGPVLEASAITETALFGILHAAGQSCECELDRSWMRGPRIPLRWDAALRTRAAERLGFDPENPRVKAEISALLARGPSSDAGSDPLREGLTIEEMLMAYSEEDAVESDAVTTPAAELSGSEPHAAPSAWPRLLAALGAALAVSLAVGALVLARNRGA